MHDLDMERMLSERREDAERIIGKYMPDGAGFTVVDAMRYSVLAGGKRLRPILMLECYRLFGGGGQAIEPFAAAIEMIHTYSLVHDDLPAMDNDMYRRGMPTTHAKYGEAMGILAGDGLLTYAFETAAKAFGLTESPQLAGRAIGLLAEKAGIAGMLGGQAIDVENEKTGGRSLSLDDVVRIHRMKTAALIEAAMMIGPIMAGAGSDDVEKMEQIARDIGVAFQIRDDILDVTGTQETLGKPVGSDAKNSKETYVTLAGLDAAAAEAKRLSRRAAEGLGRLPGDTLFLENLALMLAAREK